MQAVGFLPEVVQDVLRDLAYAIGVQQGLLVFRGAELFFILLGFNGLELRPHIVVIDLELEHLFIANRIGDHVRMQFTAKHACSVFCS
ncbi:hypothetical protein D3C84_406090 [compost metagenome]